MPETYNGDLAAEVILDFARFDRIGGILGDHLVQIWYSFSMDPCHGNKKLVADHSRLIPILNIALK